MMHAKVSSSTRISSTVGLRASKSTPRCCPVPSRRVIVKASADESEDDFEARLAALKTAKGETPYGEGVKKLKANAKKAAADASSSSYKAPAYDYTNETVFFESGPHGGDVAVNLALGATLVWLPLSIAAVGRAAFVKYRFTDRRLSCITTAPWKNEQLDAAYQEVKDVVTIGRGIGLWGDMLVTLNDGSKIEMRAMPKHVEMKEYILKKRDELTSKSGGSGNALAAAETNDTSKGFA